MNETVAKRPPLKRRGVQIVLAVFLVLALCSLFIMVINHRFPSFFTPEKQSKRGLMYTDTLIAIGDQLFANWLPNDRVWPTVLLDNPQNFQLGDLEAIRYSVRVMRDKLSKLRSTDHIDPNCDRAFTHLSIEAGSWYFPSAESEYRAAMDELRTYRARLAEGRAEFYPRADNLSEMLDQYVSLLGGVNTRLANAPHRQRYKISEEEAASDQPAQIVDTKVPWRKIDDNFYYAQGVAYTLRQIMAAIKYDFQEILDVKKASVQVDSIIEVLDQSQFEPWVVLNGDIGSITANHSMELHSILENARQKIRNLNDMLRQ